MFLFNKIIFPFIESLIRNISGGLGQRIRFQYYKRRFKNCGKNVKIDEGVIFQTPENMSIGNDVWFLPYSIISARPSYTNLDERVLRKKNNKAFDIDIGNISIGNEVMIGAYNIIQGFGGIIIRNKVTTSARVSIYSFSHVPYDKSDRSKITYANSMIKSDPVACIESPIVIENGVWLGLNVIVFAGNIGENSFISSNSIVLNDIPINSYVSKNSISKRFSQKT